MALGVMAGLWPLRPRYLHAGFWAGERVKMSVSRQNLQLQAFMSTSALCQVRNNFGTPLIVAR
ncbi:hypothetical protein CYJ91_08425 [Lacticaseibacillus rhamnosus]|uniref:Uncharacterized protein n=1 Tax=Lacticaseibacillus rhamnosus TaxID=47715 RepID=A0AAP8LVW2_LACRH|nr:hypothetical protein CYJ91_08425 [Lacticaseibacillus rhamnosus]